MMRIEVKSMGFMMNAPVKQISQRTSGKISTGWPEKAKEASDELGDLVNKTLEEGPIVIVESMGQGLMDTIQTPEGIATVAGTVIGSFAGAKLAPKVKSIPAKAKDYWKNIRNKGGSGSKYEITWNKTINATQEVTEGTNIPKSFKIKGLNVNGKEVWVHGNATKHMGEYVNSAKGSIIIENEMMLSFQETISQILPEVKLERNFFNINGWEIGINGDTGVIYHALYK